MNICSKKVHNNYIMSMAVKINQLKFMIID